MYCFVAGVVCGLCLEYAVGKLAGLSGSSFYGLCLILWVLFAAGSLDIALYWLLVVGPVYGHGFWLPRLMRPWVLHSLVVVVGVERVGGPRSGVVVALAWRWVLGFPVC